MIPLIEINLFSAKFHVSAETIEKDYIISWILLCLTRSFFKDHFIFYGGTAIKRIYFEDHRFSEDIDLLSATFFSLDKILDGLSCLDYARKKANLSLEINQSNTIVSKSRVQLYINYSGYEEIIGAPKEIRLDFSMNMDLYGKNNDRKIIETYSDTKTHNASLSVMSLNTILANKLGLLLDHTRNEPRDLYDIWFLLMRTKEFEFNNHQVCEDFKEKYSFYPSEKNLAPHLNNSSIMKNWHIRLSKQLAELPDINDVIKDIRVKLVDLF